MSTISRNLFSIACTTVISLSGAACDAEDFEPMGEISEHRSGGGWSGMTLNTHAWVSPSSRDIYEFDRNGNWTTNGYGYEVQLTKIKFEHPLSGWVTTDPSSPNSTHVKIKSGSEFKLRYVSPFPGMSKNFTGSSLVGTELTFLVRFNGLTYSETKLRIVGHDDDPQGDSMYEFVKINPSNNQEMGPICELAPDGTRHAAVYRDITVDLQDGNIETENDMVHIACSAAAPGKSPSFGYRPEIGNMQFRTANRVIRADYCGDGQPFTFPGNSLLIKDNFSAGQEGTTLADVYTNIGSLKLEAMWDQHGILCIDTPRVDTLEPTDIMCPMKYLTGTWEYNWQPPACDGFVDPYPGTTKFFSLIDPGV